MIKFRSRLSFLKNHSLEFSGKLESFLNWWDPSSPSSAREFSYINILQFSEKLKRSSKKKFSHLLIRIANWIGTGSESRWWYLMNIHLTPLIGINIDTSFSSRRDKATTAQISGKLSVRFVQAAFSLSCWFYELPLKHITLISRLLYWLIKPRNRHTVSSHELCSLLVFLATIVAARCCGQSKHSTESREKKIHRI